MDSVGNLFAGCQRILHTKTGENGKGAQPVSLLSYRRKYANGKLLRIRTNTYGDISHIGYKLFNDEIMQLHGESPVSTSSKDTCSN